MFSWTHALLKFEYLHIIKTPAVSPPLSVVHSPYTSAPKELTFFVLSHQGLRRPRANVRKMRYSISTFVVSVFALLAPLGVKANTPLSDSFVQNDVAVNKGYEIAWASRP